MLIPLFRSFSYFHAEPFSPLYFAAINIITCSADQIFRHSESPDYCHLFTAAEFAIDRHPAEGASREPLLPSLRQPPFLPPRAMRVAAQPLAPRFILSRERAKPPRAAADALLLFLRCCRC